MKSFLISILLLTFLYSTNLFAQDIKAKLKGHEAEDGFTVVDDNEKTLLKVTGEGDVGVNTDNPSALFHVFGGSSNLANGKPIKIIAQDGTEMGGFILLQGGIGGINYAGDAGRLIVEGGKENGYGGGIHILSGDGEDYGGGINIETSSLFIS